MAPKLASSIVYPDTFEKRIGLDLSSGHPSQKRIGLDLSRLGRAGKRLFLSQALSRTEAKTEVTVIIALPRPAPVAATFGDQLITKIRGFFAHTGQSSAPEVGSWRILLSLKTKPENQVKKSRKSKKKTIKTTKGAVD